jgi:hypothetical protein
MGTPGQPLQFFLSFNRAGLGRKQGETKIFDGLHNFEVNFED